MLVAKCFLRLHQQTASANANVRNGFHKISDSASIREATFNVVLLPVDVIDLAWNVSAHNVIFFNFGKGQMGIVDSDKNDSSVGSTVEEDFVIDLWDGDLSCRTIHIQVNLS